MDRRMTHERKTTAEKFGAALSDAFQDAPACGALGAFDDLSRRRMINDVLDAASLVEAETDLRLPTGRRTAGIWTVGIAAGFVALLVSGVFWLTMGGAGTPSPDVYFGEVYSGSANLFIDGKGTAIHAPVPVGKSMHTTDGDAQLRLPTGIDWWMNKHSAADISSFDSEQIQVSVRSGEVWFRVDPARKGPAFSIDTDMGRIEVIGTIFAVKVMPGAVRVTLLKGAVRVVRPTGQVDQVPEAYSMNLRESEPKPLARGEVVQIREQLAALSWDSGAVFDALEPETAPNAESAESNAVAESLAQPERRPAAPEGDRADPCAAR